MIARSKTLKNWQQNLRRMKGGVTGKQMNRKTQIRTDVLEDILGRKNERRDKDYMRETEKDLSLLKM